MNKETLKINLNSENREKRKPALPLRYTGTMKGLMEILDDLIKPDLAPNTFNTDQSA
jgi:hypothetical protein